MRFVSSISLSVDCVIRLSGLTDCKAIKRVPCFAAEKRLLKIPASEWNQKYTPTFELKLTKVKKRFHF